MKGNDVMAHLSRFQRRELLKKERRARKTGEWGPWERIDLSNGLPSSWRKGWLKEVRRAYKNKVFSVLWRPVTGGVHLAVSSLSELRPSWYEMQRIKDEIAGEDAIAIEIYPKRSEIVDGADMFHIWVCDDELPFNLYRDQSDSPAEPMLRSEQLTKEWGDKIGAELVKQRIERERME